MKTLIFFNLLLFNLFSFAQNLDAEFLSYQGRRLGTSVEKVIDVAERLAEEKNIDVKRVKLKTSKGVDYLALQILPGNTSEQNREASRISTLMNGLPLVFSPYDLSLGSNAFFDPNGSKIGVPYQYFLNAKDPSYLHELEHAGTYLKVLSGKASPWAGLMKVNKGTYLSSRNNQYYFRFAALDEIVATALSVDLETKALMELERTQTPAEFYRSRGEADQLLNSIYQTALAGKYLARQVVDLTERALRDLSLAEVKAEKLTLGKLTKGIFSVHFVLDSYSWEIVGGRGQNVAIPQGTLFTLYSSTKPSASDVKSRLMLLKSKAAQAEIHFTNVEKKIYVLIEYPDLKKTDLKGLEANSSIPYKNL